MPQDNVAASSQSNDLPPSSQRAEAFTRIKIPSHIGDVISHASISALKNDPNYNAAKKDGDAVAACTLVNRFVDPQKIEAIANSIDKRSPVRIATPYAKEEGGTNAIPLAFAKYVEQKLKKLGFNDNSLQKMKT